MTLPNKLTVTRLFLAPLIFFSWYLAIHLALFPQFGVVLLCVFFALSEITDILDGHIARSRNLVSDIGKLMDPFSDVFLRMTYFLCFVGAGLMPLWTMAVILWRELSIMFIRMLLVREGTTMAANTGGKLKSLLYFLSGAGGLIGLILSTWRPELSWLPLAREFIAWIFILAALASLVSFGGYLRSYLGSQTHRRFLSE